MSSDYEDDFDDDTSSDKPVRRADEFSSYNGSMSSTESSHLLGGAPEGPRYPTEFSHSLMQTSGSPTTVPVKYDITGRPRNRSHTSVVAGSPEGGVVHHSNYTSVEVVGDPKTLSRSYRNADNNDDVDEEGAVKLSSVNRTAPTVGSPTASTPRRPTGTSSSYSSSTASTTSSLERQSVKSPPSHSARLSSRATTVVSMRSSLSSPSGSVPPVTRQSRSSQISSRHRRFISVVEGEEWQAATFDENCNPSAHLGRGSDARGSTSPLDAIQPSSEHDQLVCQVMEMRGQIREWNNRITKLEEDFEVRIRRREGESARRQEDSASRALRIQKLRSRNADLEVAYAEYGEEMITVNTLLRRYQKQLEKAQTRLKDAKTAVRALGNRDKRAAHAIETLHRRMPSKEEVMRRQVNEGFYNQATLENQLKTLKESIRKTKASRDLMRQKASALEKEVEQKKCAAISPKDYEQLRETHENNQRLIDRHKAAIAMYSNVVHSTASNPRSRRASVAADDHSLEVEALASRRRELHDAVEAIKATIAERERKIQANAGRTGNEAAPLKVVSPSAKKPIALLSPKKPPTPRNAKNSPLSPTSKKPAKLRKRSTASDTQPTAKVPAAPSAADSSARAQPRGVLTAAAAVAVPSPPGSAVGLKESERPPSSVKDELSAEHQGATRLGSDGTGARRVISQKPNSALYKLDTSVQSDDSLSEVLRAIDADSKQLGKLGVNLMDTPMKRPSTTSDASVLSPADDTAVEEGAHLVSESVSVLKKSNEYDDVSDAVLSVTEESGRSTPAWLR